MGIDSAKVKERISKIAKNEKLSVLVKRKRILIFIYNQLLKFLINKRCSN
jgi:hypothetical protein